MLRLFLILILGSFAYSEKVAICPTRLVNFDGLPGNYHATGETCSFNSKPGERIITRGKWVGHNAALKVYLRHSPLPREVYFNSSANQYLIERIADNEVSNLRTRYSLYIPNTSSYTGQAEIETYAERSNLRALMPTLNVMTGELKIPWQVNTNESFVPARYVDIHLYGNRDGISREGNIAMWDLAHCVNRGLCSHTYVQSIAQRAPIPRGATHITAIIDPDDNHAETNEDTGDNRQALNLSPFIFEEKIPGVLQNMGPSFELARKLLNTWLDRNLRIKSNTSGIDWGLPVAIPAQENTGWALLPENASNSRVRDRYQRIVQPSYFLQKEQRDTIKALVRGRFAQNPTVNSVKLFDKYTGQTTSNLIKNYHRQHIQFILGQQNYNEASLDGITAALGRFAMYLIPFGEAVKYGPNEYEIRIKRLGIHIVDSFDFNGSQPLGCWREPNAGGLFPFTGAYCAFNSTFNRYRMAKARGGDYTLFMRPIEYDIEPNVKFRIRR